MTLPDGDRRVALKTRHRQAIVDAAAALMDERHGTAFTVDELAQRAGVSRRTVFNHFASLDDVVAEVCGDVLSSVVDSLVAARPSTGSPQPATSMVDEIVEGFRSADLVGPMSYLTRVLGDCDPKSAQGKGLMALRAFTELNERIRAEQLRRRPDTDPLALDLLVGALTSGVGVLHHHWAAATGAVDSPESRRIWSELLEQLIETVRAGHGAGAPPTTTPESGDAPSPTLS
ncbi:TetR/AcrR family transcriptional regulator [Cellulomonas timonensis]|uniref:TetR/AcrR family transcriptional regulator n=1 Tax=Cellulomonas timonensis TaxID=1689271 RepID=UPI000B0926FD|nr:TetR/AcrR family transcriptional regulator [Cellulomonas timonensis]